MFFIGCDSLDNPTGSVINESIIKTETKWSVNISNDIKENKIYSKEYDIKGNILTNTNYYESGEIDCKSVFTYEDDKKSTEEKINYDKSGDMLNKTYTEYTYNFEGLILKSVKYNNSGEVENVFNYVYDSDGNLIKKINANAVQDTLISIEYSYKFNLNGNIVERISNNLKSPDNIIKDVLIYSSNNKVEVFNYHGGNLNTVTSYFYNKYGNIFKEIVADSDGNIINKYIYEYTYH